MWSVRYTHTHFVRETQRNAKIKCIFQFETDQLTGIKIILTLQQINRMLFTVSPKSIRKNWVSVSLSGTFNALNFLRSKDKRLKVNIDWMPSYFVCAIKFALQLGHDLFCNRHGFCSQLVGLVAISPSKLGHSTLKVVSLHRGSERKTRTKNRNIMIKCKKRMWTTFQSERTLSVCVSLWGFTSTSWVKHSFALSRTCNFFQSSENSCGATHQFQSIPHEIKSHQPTIFQIYATLLICT